jgi:hypothetical protein
MSDTNLSESATAPKQKRTPFKFTYINRSKCKKFALEFAKANRAQKFTRVSEDFLISCEAALKQHIQFRVKSHPSVGKTLT